ASCPESSSEGSRCLALRRVIRSDAFAIFFALLTAYTLLVPDLLLAYGQSTEYTPALAVVNTVVLGLFLLESVTSCLLVNGYVRSGRVVLDIMAMVSIAGDTWMGQRFLVHNGAVAGRATKILNAVRFGSRSSRLVSILRFARLFRIVQFLRIFHTIVWNSYLRPHQGLAYTLYHKRLWRVFQDLDSRENDRLSSEEVELFFMALKLEFPAPAHLKTLQTRTSLWSGGTSRSSTRKSTTATGGTRSSKWSKQSIGTRLASLPSTWMQAFDLDKRAECDGSFISLVRDLRSRPEGQRALQKCQEDVQRVKASCSLVKKVSGPVVAKVCLIVLAMMAVVAVMENVKDLGDLQGLAHMDSLAQCQSVPQAQLCALAE
ncbi:unnamed protein product, partial [Polarella glacialis]